MEITYLICNHNYSEYIETAITSVLSQDYEGKINCCIIDDGSTDDSVDKIENMFSEQKELEGVSAGIEYSVFDVNGIDIHLFKNEKNSGPSRARNIGIEHHILHTDVFAILDMDDWVEYNKTSALVPYFYDGGIGAVYADYITHNTENDNQTKVYKEIFSRDRLIQECIVHSGSFVSKQALLAVKDQFGYYDENLRVCEDYDLWLRISEKFTMVHHPEFLTNVRVTPKNSTNSVSKHIWQRDYTRVMEKFKLRNNLK